MMPAGHPHHGVMIEGHCHCGALRWRYEVAPEGATACNCTVCRRYGALWIYAWENDGIALSGDSRAYVRGQAIEFHFCPHCGNVGWWRGLRLDADGRRRCAVNLRLATDPAAVAAIPIDHFDGFDTFDDLPRDGRCVVDYWF